MSNDKPSPRSVEKVLDSPRAKADRRDKELERVRDEGFKEGLRKGRQEIIDWLQAAYIGPNSPDRETPEAEAILKLARDASLHFKEKTNGRRR